MKSDDRELDPQIDRVLRRHFSPPTGVGARALAGLDGAPAGGTEPSGRRGGWRVLAPYLAAAALVAAAATLFLRPNASEPRQEDGPVLATMEGLEQPGCELEGIFTNAVSNADAAAEGSAIGLSAPDEWDSSLLSQVGPTTCSGEDAVWVVGRFADPRLENSHLVMCRAGAEAVMLVVPESDCDPGICLPDQGDLRVHSGVWKGRDVYEVSRLDESRILSCFGASPREF